MFALYNFKIFSWFCIKRPTYSLKGRYNPKNLIINDIGLLAFTSNDDYFLHIAYWPQRNLLIAIFLC